MESDDCAGKATFSAASGNGPHATFTVTGVAAVTCTATIKDALNQQTTTQVVVTTNGFIINGKIRR
jgi:hypothetical protein